MTLGSGLATIGVDAFSSTSLSSVIIPDSVTTIGDNTFGFISTLTSVTLGTGLVTIGGGAFTGTSLVSVYS